MLGQVVMELAPKSGNPRNSEGAFLTLKDGGLLFCYTAFEGDSARDFTKANLAKIETHDGGKTWSAPEVFLTAQAHDAMNIMSVSLLRMKNGDIGLFYLVRKSWSDMRIVLRRSSDDGKTWSQPRFCIPREGYFVMNNDRAVRLKSGRILLPAAEHIPTYGDTLVPHFSAATATAFYSDDDGETWHESAHCISINETHSKAGLQEPGVVELENGCLYGFARTDLCLQYEFFSMNEGKTWSGATPSRFTSPLSPMSMKRLPDGRLMALWNPVPEYMTRHADKRTGGRTPFVFALSEDDGETWTEENVLEDDPLGGYCYTAMTAHDDALFLGYCAGDTRRDQSCLNRLRIRKIPLSELEQAGKPAQNAHRMGIGF